MNGPQKREPRLAGRGIADETTESAPILAPDPSWSNEKLQANLIAGFALVGFAVHTLSVGGFIVARWNLSKHCPDLGALVAFAKQVGVRV
jgi:hypothetical protein